MEAIMATLSLPGIYSNIDSGVLVEAALAASRAPLRQLENRKSAWKQKSAAIEEIEGKLRKLRTLAEDLRDIETLRGTSVSSSNEGVLTASGGTGATQGTHEVVVNRLASSERGVHSGVAAADTLVGAGAFSYTYDGVTRTVYTSDETTLEGLRDLINNDASNPGVAASIMEVGVDSEHVYHLVLSGRDSGGDYAIDVNDAATTLDGTNGTVDFRQLSFTRTQTAQDSQFRVDGYPPSGWIERSSNSIGDVISGVTMELQGVGTARLSLNRKDNNITQALKALPDLYNALVDTVDKYTGYDEETGKGAALQGSLTINSTLQQIRSAIVSRAPGFDGQLDALALPAQLGYSFDKEGKLSLDSGTLDEALSENFTELLHVVGANNRGVSTSDFVQFDSAMDATQPGAYEIEIEWAADQTITAARIRLEGETEWRSMLVSGNTLTGGSSSPEEGLSLTAVYPGSAGTHTAGVRIQKGFGAELADRLDEMLDATNGSIATQKQYIESSIKRLDSRIEFQETRLETREKHLRAKYARLEATLAEIDSMNSAFYSLFQQLDQNQQYMNSKQ
jgi:flagellar hook-associated protein 2